MLSNNKFENKLSDLESRLCKCEVTLNKVVKYLKKDNQRIKLLCKQLDDAVYMVKFLLPHLKKIHGLEKSIEDIKISSENYFIFQIVILKTYIKLCY